MDRKIGEKFVYNNNIYVVVGGGWCQTCDLLECNCHCLASINTIPYCVPALREDNHEVIFKKIGKVAVKDLD